MHAHTHAHTHTQPGPPTTFHLSFTSWLGCSKSSVVMVTVGGLRREGRLRPGGSTTTSGLEGSTVAATSLPHPSSAHCKHLPAAKPPNNQSGPVRGLFFSGQHTLPVCGFGLFFACLLLLFSSVFVFSCTTLCHGFTGLVSI